MDFIVFLSEQWLLVLILAVLASALIFVEGKRGGNTLSYHQVVRHVNAGDGLILDVRDAKEYKAGHIVDALNIPHAKLAERLTELDKHKSKIIIVADKMGQHSGASGKLLKQNGFNVSRLQGGMTEWLGQNLPVVKT